MQPCSCTSQQLQILNRMQDDAESVSVTYCRGTKLGLVRASATRNSCLDSCGACFRNAKNGMHSTIWGQSTYDCLTWQSITKLPSRTLNLRAFPFNVLDKLLKPTLDLTSSIRTPRSCNSSPQQSPPQQFRAVQGPCVDPSKQGNYI